MKTKAWILVVEDDRFIRPSLIEILEIEGFQVQGAENGLMALEKLKEEGPLPSLILLDLMMTGMDGYEFRKIQSVDERLKNIPVVIMSADRLIDQKNAELGTAGFLKKPVSIDKLLETASSFCS